MFKKAGSEIEILSFMLVIFLTVVITGILAFRGFQSIVTEVSHSSEPELKLTLVKEVVSDVSEAENNIKSYNLTRNVKYLRPFYNSILIADKNFTKLKTLTETYPDQLQIVEQMEVLVDEKYSVLNEMLSLYPDENIKNELAKISIKMASETGQKYKNGEPGINLKPQKRSFFQRLFGKSTINDSSVIEKQQKAELQDHKQLQRNIIDEIEKVNRQHIEEKNLLKQRELFLVEKSGSLMAQIRELFSNIENIEKKLIAEKISQATLRAKQTNRMVASFCVMAGLLLIIVSFVLVKYLQKKRRYEEFLREGKNQAEHLAYSKEIFLANMSHEIRTPMNAISGFTNQLLKTKLDPEQREQLEIVQISNDHLIRIVNDILDYSKMQAGKFSFENVSFNPDKILKEIISLSAQLKKNANIKINYKAVTPMPEFVIGDPGRLRQIILNLLSNSIKFTEKGEINIKAGFTQITGHGFLFNLEVSDTGIGIPQGKINEVFGEFQQADAGIYYKFGGTGLGLPITKKLVELQNGTINIESKEGKGTTTTITIPYTECVAGGVYFKDSGKPVIVDEKFLKTLKVLIADDDEYNRKLLNVILRKWNADVKEAKNGKEVVEEMMKNRYDILLMDIRMPEMNGIEAAERIRNLKDSVKAETPIIALSAVTTEEKRKRCKEAGINDFLSKPFKEEELFKKIRKLADRNDPVSNEKQNTKTDSI
jgi:signal transduction histidine kinase/CheY-like chemotaxis protein